MSEIEYTETIHRKRTVKLRPCKGCGGTDIKLWDCGYNTFNVSGGTCQKCGRKIVENNLDNPPKAKLAAIWNNAQKPTEAENLKTRLNRAQRKANKLRKQLRDAGIEPCA